MIDRRTFVRLVAGTPALALSACGGGGGSGAPGADRAGLIDVHAHVFNGRDVPAAGFIRQVVLREPRAPVDPDLKADPLLKLLARIMLRDTPSAAEELRELAGPRALRTSADLSAQDEGRVAAGLRAFEAAAGRDFHGVETSRADDLALIEHLYGLAGVTDAAARATGRADRAGLFAAVIYDRKTVVQRLNLSLASLFQAIRWAGLMTRARRDIAVEMVRLYRPPSRIEVYCAALVDFDHWLKIEDPGASPQDDQVAVMSALARQTDDVVLLNFVAFCPLRAAVEAAAGVTDTLARVRRAIGSMGFAGVKLYPPMGFQPQSNARLTFDFARTPPPGGGAALDRQLARLFDWCARNDVPVMAHAANSFGAGPDTGQRAHPGHWRPVLESIAGLRVNLAHFGGFEEGGAQGDPPWEAVMADLAVASPDRLFVDLGFWSETLSGQTARVAAQARHLLASHPMLARQLMYGSDYAMLGIALDHEHYWSSTQDALRAAGLDPAGIDAVTGGNALRFLGLDRDGPQRRRLQAFFAGNVAWRRLMARVGA